MTDGRRQEGTNGWSKEECWEWEGKEDKGRNEEKVLMVKSLWTIEMKDKAVLGRKRRLCRVSLGEKMKEERREERKNGG